jgi:hypothetical protein
LTRHFSELPKDEEDIRRRALNVKVSVQANVEKKKGGSGEDRALPGKVGQS